jgi:hypothetical protein
MAMRDHVGLDEIDVLVVEFHEEIGPKEPRAEQEMGDDEDSDPRSYRFAMTAEKIVQSLMYRRIGLLRPGHQPESNNRY